MRRLGVLALLVTVLSTCCTPPSSAVAPPTEAPRHTPVPLASPEEAPPPRGGPVEEPPVASPPIVRPQTLARPAVSLERRPFPIGPIPRFVPASAVDTQMFAASMPGVARSYGELLTKYANLPRLTPQEQESTRNQFDAMHASPRYVEVLRGWLAMRGADEEVAIEIRDIALERAYAKPWGRPALVELRFVLVDRHTSAIVGSSERERTVRLRLSVAGDWRIVDVFDATAGRWVEGESGRYSTLSLENEIPDVVAEYLVAESYAAGIGGFWLGRTPTTTFWKARSAAIGALAIRADRGTLTDRHFENVTARILRFDPATYLGDGVVTVSVSGVLIEGAGDGPTRVVPFSQALKFLRTYSGRVGWTAVDAQESDGSWVSDGDLALGDTDISFG